MLNKQKFWDLVNIRCGWSLSRTPWKCACSNKFNIEHALTCTKRFHHATLWQTMKHHRQPTKISMSQRSHWTYITKADKQTIVTKSNQHVRWNEIRHNSKGILSIRLNRIFDIRVLCSIAVRYVNQSLQRYFSSNENEKKTKYIDKVMNVEQGRFTPLEFSANGSMGRESKRFYSVLPEMIVTKHEQKYHITMPWLPRKISFLLIRSILFYIRVSRDKNSSQEEMKVANDIKLSEQLSIVCKQ